MATLGFSDLKNTALPSLWDEGEIVKARLAEGVTIQQLVGDVEAGLAELNGQLLGMAHYADLFAAQDEPEVEYPSGTDNGFEEAREYSAPDPRRGKTTGHMLPLVPYDRSLGWTMMYLRKARVKTLDADVRSVVVDAKNLWQQKLLTRFFKVEGVTVGSTSDASVPFADGGDEGGSQVDTDYVPLTSPEGETFDNAHDHFLDKSTAGVKADTYNAACVNAALEHLSEHGHVSPFDMVAARVDAGDWGDVTGFKAPEWPGIVYHSSAVERAGIGAISEYFGYFETDYGIARLWLTPRVPQYYFGVFKAYGPGDPRNPLRVRIDPNVGFGYRLVPGNWINAPGLMAVVYTEFGVGVGQDRTNGVAVDLNSASYTTPTIS